MKKWIFAYFIILSAGVAAIWVNSGYIHAFICGVFWGLLFWLEVKRDKIIRKLNRSYFRLGYLRGRRAESRDKSFYKTGFNRGAFCALYNLVKRTFANDPAELQKHLDALHENYHQDPKDAPP